MAEFATAPAADIALVSIIATSGKWNGYAVLHAEGCAHTFREGAEVQAFDLAESEPFTDDFYAVAPCAKARRTR